MKDHLAYTNRLGAVIGVWWVDDRWFSEMEQAKDHVIRETGCTKEEAMWYLGQLPVTVSAVEVA